MGFNTTNSESERELTFQHLNRYGINPFAAKALVVEYIEKVSPRPLVVTVNLESKAKDIMDLREGTKRQVYIEMRTPGRVGVKATDIGVNNTMLKMLALSYYLNRRPKPFSFLFAGVEIHLRTPGVAEDKYTNIARNIMARK